MRCLVKRNKRLTAAAVMILAALIVAAPASALPGWSNPVKISGDVELVIDPNTRIAVDSNGHLHVA